MMTNNNKLFLESKIFFQKLSKDSKKRLKKVNYDLGGGGAYNLLYFLVRKYKPKIVLETGVAAGFSSNAILNAMQQNKRGRLYSSDFPYFRIPRPESFIGILVDEHLKKNWNLFIEGDRLNIKKIKNKIKKNKVDLIHYDSDKTYLGKKKFFDTIEGFIHKKTIIIIDDIQDDIFFEEYSKKYTTRDIKIFKFKNKYLGLIY